MPFKEITEKDIEQASRPWNKLDKEEQLFHVCTFGKNTYKLEKLLSGRVDINAKNKWGEYPLYRAIHGGCPKFVEKMLDKGADPNIVSGYGATSLDLIEELIDTLEWRFKEEQENFQKRKKYMQDNNCLIPELPKDVLDGTGPFTPFWYIPKYKEIQEMLEKKGTKHARDLGEDATKLDSPSKKS